MSDASNDAPRVPQLRLLGDGFDDVYGDPDLDTWCTPLIITNAIGPVATDPCSNNRSTVQARRTFQLDRGEDGLILAPTVSLDEIVFVNCPYSRGQVIKWVRAYGGHRFIFLLRLDTSTKWFAELMDVTATICVLREQRTAFAPPPGVKPSSNVFPHALFYARDLDVTDEIRALCYRWSVCR